MTPASTIYKNLLLLPADLNRLKVEFDIESAPDQWALMLNEKGRLPSEESLVFYGQTTAYNEAIKLVQDVQDGRLISEHFELNLEAIPHTVHSIVLVAASEMEPGTGPKRMNLTKEACIRLTGLDNTRWDVTFKPSKVLKGKAKRLTWGAFVRQEGQWRFEPYFRAERQFGISTILKAHGARIDKTEEGRSLSV